MMRRVCVSLKELGNAERGKCREKGKGCVVLSNKPTSMNHVQST